MRRCNWKEAFENIKAEVLFMSWPESFGLEAIKAWTGPKVVYVGGCQDSKWGPAGRQIMGELCSARGWDVQKHTTEHTLVDQECTLMCVKVSEDADGPA